MDNTSPRLIKILKTPPRHLTEIERLLLEFNGFFKKQYLKKWRQLLPLDLDRPHLDYTFDRGGHVMN